MSTGGIVAAVMAVIVVLMSMVFVGTYNGLMRKEENITATERQVASCYQKRADQISNQAASVERIMGQEKDVIIGNANLRSNAQSVRLPENATVDQINEFIKAQGNLLARMSSVVENSPNIATAANMALFQRDLKQVENQCNVLRNRQIEAVKVFNTSLRTFPSNFVAGFAGLSVKKQIEFENEEQNRRSPRVFNAK